MIKEKRKRRRMNKRALYTCMCTIESCTYMYIARTKCDKVAIALCNCNLVVIVVVVIIICGAFEDTTL